MSNAESKPTTTLPALATTLSGPPAGRPEDSHYAPRPQSYYAWDGKSWIQNTSFSSSSSSTCSTELDSSRMRLLTWNIDVLSGGIEPRMAAALLHLSDVVASTDPAIPVIICLQEMGRSDLQQISEAGWIRDRFFVTDIDSWNWASAFYGTVMLIDKRLRIQKVQRVNWFSRMSRDGLFVDIPLQKGSADNSSTMEEHANVLRVCNTHLESLAANPPVRPKQMETAGKILHEPNVAAALLTGDLNAIQPFDGTLHTENGLQDLYLALGGKEHDPEGHTWGPQASKASYERFGGSRMDKMLFRGELHGLGLEKIGVGISATGNWAERIRESGGEPWASDHFGLAGDFEVTGAWRLVSINRGRKEEAMLP